MSVWDELVDEYEDISCKMELTPEYIKLGNKWIQVKVEGDLLLREKRSLLTYGGMLRDENDRLEKKLEAIRGVVDTWDQYEDIGWHCKQLQSDIREVLGVLGMQEKK